MNAALLAADHLPPASLPHARELRDGLRRLLAAEHAAAADFLVALADFDARRGWEPLGHASLFGFLTRELRLSKGGAFFRLSAARLVVRFPEVLAALRDGRLCITSVAELARVLTPENLPEVLPRFFGCSSREAREVAAALAPREAPPLRMVVTALPVPPRGATSRSGPAMASAPPETRPPSLPAVAVSAPASTSPTLARVAEVQSTESHAPRPREEVEPLDADLRRLHLTVSRRLLDKVARARDGLSQALPGATTEQVLEAALDLLLEKQARAKALVRRPRAGAGPSGGQPRSEVPSAAGARAASSPGRFVPAAVEREVRLRDGDRCQFPLDGGGVCSSTFQVQLDHLTPRALGGETTPANLRCACARHNRYAARLALGDAAAGERGRGAVRRRGSGRPR